MNLKFSKHARERMRQRDISEKQVISIIKNPDRVIDRKKEDDYMIYQALRNDKKNTNYLFRVFVNTKTDYLTVITVYKTSKLEKYL